MPRIPAYQIALVLGAIAMMLPFLFESAALADTKSPGEVPTRAQVPEKYRWDLSDLYKNDDAWTMDIDRARKLLEQFRAFQARIDSADALAKVLKLRDDLFVCVERIRVYASLRHDEDTNDKKAQGQNQMAVHLSNQVQEGTSWFIPSLLALPEETVQSWIDSTPESRVYKHWWDDVQRQRVHFRNTSEEKLLALAGSIADGPSTTFSLFTNADLKFGTIKDENGKDVTLSTGRYMGAIYSPNRNYRRDAFIGLHTVYFNHANTLASLLSNQVKTDVFAAKARNYGSAREASLGPNAIPTEVYDALVGTINKSLPLLHRYTDLRKRILKLDELHPYDLYVPLVTDVKEDIKYDDAVKTILEALAVLGPEYTTPMKTGFESRWIDVYETQNKRSGAYCSGSYSTHPFLLLNYENNANARSTVAHEMGHAMHSWFTQHNQPPIYGDYTIFCAEVASTVNEALLNNYLLKKAGADAARLRLVNSSLENIRTTVFRQTLFAEFEQLIHQMGEKGQPLTSDKLFAEYRKLYEKYYGPTLVLDPVLDAECLRIPHFYRNFYVYQYATSYCAATNIARRIIAGEAGAVDGLLKFLKSGSSAYSIDILKLAGVDMATEQPFAETMKLFAEELDEMERLLRATGAM